METNGPWVCTHGLFNLHASMLHETASSARIFFYSMKKFIMPLHSADKTVEIDHEACVSQLGHQNDEYFLALHLSSIQVVS